MRFLVPFLSENRAVPKGVLRKGEFYRKASRGGKLSTAIPCTLKCFMTSLRRSYDEFMTQARKCRKVSQSVVKCRKVSQSGNALYDTS